MIQDIHGQTIRNGDAVCHNGSYKAGRIYYDEDQNAWFVHNVAPFQYNKHPLQIDEHAILIHDINSFSLIRINVNDHVSESRFEAVDDLIDFLSEKLGLKLIEIDDGILRYTIDGNIDLQDTTRYTFNQFRIDTASTINDYLNR